VLVNCGLLGICGKRDFLARDPWSRDVPDLGSRLVAVFEDGAPRGRSQILTSSPLSSTHVLMSSRTVLGRHKLADRLDRSAAPSMVSCKYCVKRNLSCRLSSLDRRCTNCVRFGCRKCEPEEIPLPDFSKLDAEMARIEKEEEEAEAKLRVEETIAEEALTRARRLRERMEKLRNSRKRLQRKEKELFSKGLSSLEELEDLEAISSDAFLQHPEAAEFLPAIDWDAMLQGSGPSAA
jgi:hypothetical protein